MGPLILSILLLAASGNWQDEVKSIDAQIEELQDLQEKLRSRAQRNANNAMRWQFQKGQEAYARKAWDQAAADKKKIQEIDTQIDDLKARKEELIKKNG